MHHHCFHYFSSSLRINGELSYRIWLHISSAAATAQIHIHMHELFWLNAIRELFTFPFTLLHFYSYKTERF